MKVAWPTLAALVIALVAMFAIWRFFPNHPEALMVAGALSTTVISQFNRLFAKRHKPYPPPTPPSPPPPPEGSPS